MHTSTKRMTEGALMVAIIGMLLLINRQFAGILEYAMYWILSFPILIYTVKYGLKAAIVPSIAMMLLSFMIAMPTTMFYLASALLCGMMYGYGVTRRWPNIALLTSTGFITLLSYVITMVLFATIFGYDPNEDIILAEQLAQYLHLGNINIGQIALIFSIVLTLLTAILQTICVHLLAVLTLKRMKLQAPVVKTIFDLSFPKWLGWISICIWVLFYLKNMLKLEGNLLVLIVSLYTVMLIIQCSECILDLMCLTVVMKQRILGMILVFVCMGALIFEPTRNVICLIGCISMITGIRQSWKRGVINGTLRKS